VQAVHRLHTASMTEIRLTWNRSVRHPLDALRFSKEWTPATAEARATMEFVLGACLSLDGAGSHWIEERDQKDAK
jgi:hypothetical protein